MFVLFIQRFAYDGLKRQRLVEPLLRLEGEDQLTPASWEEALFVVSDKVRGDVRGAFALVAYGLKYACLHSDSVLINGG